MARSPAIAFLACMLGVRWATQAASRPAHLAFRGPRPHVFESGPAPRWHGSQAAARKRQGGFALGRGLRLRGSGPVVSTRTLRSGLVCSSAEGAHALTLAADRAR